MKAFNLHLIDNLPKGNITMGKNEIAPFPLMDKDSAPVKSHSYLTKAKENFGLIPNVEKVMAQAPALLASYMNAWDEFNESSLSEIERQIVYQTANFENNCQYCTPWHTILSENAGMAEQDVESLRCGAPLLDKKHESLRIFTRELIRTQGSIEPNALKAFFNVGYSEQQAMEVILGLSIKTMSNYTNSIAQTPLDDEAMTKKWVKPSLRA